MTDFVTFECATVARRPLLGRWRTEHMYIPEDELDALAGRSQRRNKAIAAWLVGVVLIMVGIGLFRWFHGPIPRWMAVAPGPFVVLSRFAWEGLFGVYSQKRPLRR